MKYVYPAIFKRSDDGEFTEVDFPDIVCGVTCGTSYENVSDGLDRYIKQIQVQKTESKYIKHGSTWFCQSAWEDDYTTNNVTITNKNSDLDGIF